MKLTNVTSVYIKDKSNWSEKGNHRHVSTLPNISKVFQRWVYNLTSQCFQRTMSKYQCGFRKWYSAQHVLILPLEIWCKSVDQSPMFEELLTELLNAFECMLQNIFIAELCAYEFDIKVLDFIYDYLINRKQRTNIDNA